MKHLLTIICLVLTTVLFAQTTVTIPLSVKITKQAANSTIISTVWSFDSGTGGTIANSTQPSTTATLPAGTFKIRITVKDNMGNAPYFVKTVNVVDNRAPIIDAGAADTTIYLGTTSMNVKKLLAPDPGLIQTLEYHFELINGYTKEDFDSDEGYQAYKRK